MVEQNRSVDDLAVAFGVSPSTIRRDLATLAAASRILRTLGGAVAAPRVEVSWHDKATAQADAKQDIAAQAAALVPDGAVVFLDAGTSVAAVAAKLADNPTLTLVTNGLSAAVAAADAQATLIVLGGRLRRPNAGFTGVLTNYALDLVHPQIAFLGCDGIDPELGLNCPDIELASAKQNMMQRCPSSWILADHTKFARTELFAYWAKLSSATGVITDSVTATSQAGQLDALRANKHAVIVAPYITNQPAGSTA